MSGAETAKSLFFEALAFIDSSNFELAELRLRDALQFAPGNAAILTNLSVALLRQGKRGEARACAETAIAAKPDGIESLLVLADCCAHDGDLAQATAAYDRIVALDPGIAEVHNNRGIVLVKLGRFAEALDSYDRAIALGADLVDAHVNRASALRNLKRYDEALAAYRQALALAPGLAEAWFGQGNVLHDLERCDESLAAYDDALALKPDFAPAWAGRGNLLCKLRRYGEGLDAYQRALALEPDLADAWLGRGNVLRDLKRYDDAFAAYDQALAREPGLAEAWLGRGNALHDLRRNDEALAAYDKALAHNPSLTQAWLGRGAALRMLARAQESIAAYRRALELGGNAESIKYCLAALGAEPLPAASPERFIVNLYDLYADNFDHDLVVNLKYATPGLLADAIRRFASATALDIADLGCGTGLMGEQIRPLARTLTGVDLSTKMLEKARQRNVYDHLAAGDLVQFARARTESFDVAVAADVLIYIGDLSPTFAAVRRALRAGGLFGFTVEAAEDGDVVLRPTLRYAHSVGYLRKLAGQNQFAVELIEPQIIRRDAGADVGGYLAVMRCA